MFTRIDHVELLPSDVERTLAFYQEILGFRLAARHPVDSPLLKEVVYLKLGDTMVEVLSARTPASGALDPSQVGYRLLALALGTSTRAEIRDPDGLPIELRQWRTRP